MPVRAFGNVQPQIHGSVYVDKSATIIGDVTIDRNSSIWPNVVIRGENKTIRIGKRVNVQDNVVIDAKTQGRVIIGDNVSIGHGAILHGCTIGNNVIVGMGAIIMEDARIDDWVIIGAGSVVTQQTVIPSECLVLGMPGRIRRSLDQNQRDTISANAEEYVELARQYINSQ